MGPNDAVLSCQGSGHRVRSPRRHHATKVIYPRSGELQISVKHLFLVVIGSPAGVVAARLATVAVFMVISVQDHQPGRPTCVRFTISLAPESTKAIEGD